MAKLTLGFISAFNERVEPLMNGTVKAEGIELIPTYSHPAETFWRQLKFGEFEVAEMSMSSFLIAKSQGADMVALPVFPSRRLFQTELSYHIDSGITKPEDLAGKKLGVAEYQQTAALWIRGILEHDFGVSQYKIHWYMERSEEMSHGGATGFKPPPGISFNRIAPNKSLVSTLLENELDVAHVASPFVLQANTLDRSSRIAGKGRLEQNQAAVSRPHGRGSAFPQATRLSAGQSRLHYSRRYLQKISLGRVQSLHRLRQSQSLAREKLLEQIPSALFFGAGVSIDDARNDRRRSVSLRHQGQSGDARHDHRLFARART